MKFIVALLFCITFLSCKEATKESKPKMEEPEMVNEIDLLKFPKALNSVFEAHGGLDTWKRQKTLVYDLPKPNAVETHTTDLYSRKDKITTPNFSMGFDGKEVWLLDDKNEYEGDAVFYHNLMFYFYAMPFVLADEGIMYSEAEDLEFEGTSYPGIRISYEDGVGTSPKDEYYIHYDPETYQMQWLGYTVTYRSGEKSDNIKWIRYNDWMTVNGVVLPKSMTWHAYEGKKIKEAKSTVTFENVNLSKINKPESFYQKPENAVVVQKKEN